MQRLADFNKWMTDTLQAGLDSYGAFPPNVKIFDFFNLLKSPNSNYMNPIYRDSFDDYHPNALASSVVAPILVQRMFDAAITYEGIIPVELTLFKATLSNDNVELSWITATETNNQGFEVQRNNEGEFESIGFVEGHGTTTECQAYSFTDKDVTSGKYKYRLKQIDYDGKFEYSNVVEVEVSSPSEYSIAQNYPNPFNPSTKIKYSVPQSSNVVLKIYDVLGKEVATLVNEEKPVGSYEVEFNPSSLTSGVYFYKLQAGSFVDTKKMLLLK